MLQSCWMPSTFVSWEPFWFVQVVVEEEEIISPYFGLGRFEIAVMANCGKEFLVEFVSALSGHPRTRRAMKPSVARLPSRRSLRAWVKPCSTSRLQRVIIVIVEWCWMVFAKLCKIYILHIIHIDEICIKCHCVTPDRWMYAFEIVEMRGAESFADLDSLSWLNVLLSWLWPNLNRQRPQW